MRTVRAAISVLGLLLLLGCSDSSDAGAAQTAASQAAEDRAAVESLASQAATDRATAAEQLAEAKAAQAETAAPEPTRVWDPSATAAPPPRPVAIGKGRPNCNGPCTVERRLSRSFLSQYSGEQTLLLATSTDADALGHVLHAFLVDGQGAVLWEEHGFGWSWLPVDEQFGIRWDDAGHTFFRSYVADFTYLYVLDTSTGSPRLVGSPEGDAADDFQLGEVVERSGRAAFDVQETLVDCDEGEDVLLGECTNHDALYRWNGQQYVIG